MDIKIEKVSEHARIERVVFDAFETLKLPGRTHTNEHYLAHIMRDCPAFVPELNFRGLIGIGELIASIMYTKSKIIRPDGGEVETLTFGPVGVKPIFQNRGYGSTIIKHSLKQARALGYGAVIIVGHPNYYPRFGFKPASAYNLTMPDGKILDALMALELREGYLGLNGGKWYADKIFEIDETAFKEWNKTFLQGVKSE